MSPTLFNVLVDAVVRKWLVDVMDDMTLANAGFQSDDVGRLSSLFCADDGAIGSLDHEWLQRANQHLCNLFRDCTCLIPNTEKIESMSCHPGVSGISAQRLAINVATKAPARPTVKGRGKGLCVLILDAVRLLQ